MESTAIPSTHLHPRLSQLAHGGGCGCKIAPGILATLLASQTPRLDKALLVGNQNSDDAAVYQISDDRAIVMTTDFFMPMVDEAFDFGRIAAANAISDIYAMGARPLLALSLLGMPIKQLPLAVIEQVLAGGRAICDEAGIAIGGGHSIDSIEPIYGLAVVGEVHPQKVKYNHTAQAGDVLILGKPLGLGILSAAFKKDQLSQALYATMLQTMMQLNKIGAEFAELEAVHALTDVTGFGLFGHTLEMCKGAQLCARVVASQVPKIAGVIELAAKGLITGASTRNWESYAQHVRIHDTCPAQTQNLCTDPQTSGGLLVACDPSYADQLLQLFQHQGFAYASVIGEFAPLQQQNTQEVYVEVV